jgi:hypothetical protein
MKNTISRVLIVGAIAFLWYTYQTIFRVEPTPWRHPQVAPRDNQDGTVDYALISKWFKDKPGHYVIVRFPKNQGLRKSDDLDEGPVSVDGMPPVTFKAVPNRYISALYDLSKGMVPIAQSEMDKAPHNQISINFAANTVNDGEFARRVSMELKDAELACEPPIKHANGVHEYRRREGRSASEYPLCLTLTDTGARKTRGLVLHDTSNRVTAMYQCIWPPGDGPLSGLCQGVIGTLKKARILVSFYFEGDITPDQIKVITETAARRAEEAFVRYGELTAEQIFSFDKKGETP